MFDEDDDGLEVEGIEEVYVEGPEQLNRLFGNMGAAKSDRNFLAHLATARVPHTAALPKPLIPTMQRLSKIAAGLHKFQTEHEANDLRRPNQWAGVYTTSLGPGASVDCSVQPSAGQATYHFLGFAAEDSQVADFGFSSLSIGGLPMILPGAQTQPTAPVTNAVPITGMLLREASAYFNLAPYTGRDFDNNTPVKFTIVNMTSDGDAVTRRCRLLIPVQADPCGQNAAASRQHAALLKANTLKHMRKFLRI